MNPNTTLASSQLLYQNGTTEDVGRNHVGSYETCVAAINYLERLGEDVADLRASLKGYETSKIRKNVLQYIEKMNEGL